MKYAQLFSLEYFDFSWYQFLSFVDWDPSKVLVEHCRPIWDWRARNLAFPKELCVENNDEPVSLKSEALMITTMRMTCGRTNQVSSIVMRACFLLRLAAEWLWRSLMTYKEDITKIPFSKSIRPIQKARSGIPTVRNHRRTMSTRFEEPKSSYWIQYVMSSNSKEKTTLASFTFWAFGCSTASHTKCKQLDTELENLALHLKN